MTSLLLVRVDPTDRRYYDVAEGEYIRAQNWDVYDRVCAGGGLVVMRLDHADAWLKHAGTTEAAREALHLVNTTIKSYVKNDVVSRSCRSKVMGFDGRRSFLESRAR